VNKKMDKKFYLGIVVLAILIIAVTAILNMQKVQ